MAGHVSETRCVSSSSSKMFENYSQLLDVFKESHEKVFFIEKKNK